MKSIPDSLYLLFLAVDKADWEPGEIYDNFCKEVKKFLGTDDPLAQGRLIVELTRQKIRRDSGDCNHSHGLGTSRNDRARRDQETARGTDGE